jgi:hypothetical protein
VGRFQDLRFVVGMWFDGYTLMESVMVYVITIVGYC